MNDNCGLFFDGLLPQGRKQTITEPTIPIKSNRFYSEGCARKEVGSFQDNGVSLNNTHISWESLGISKPVLKTVYSLGLLLPNDVQQVAIPHILSGKSAHFHDLKQSHTLSYVLPIIENSIQTSGFLSVIVCPDNTSARVAFERAVALTKDVNPKPLLALVLSEDRLRCDENVNMLFIRADLLQIAKKITNQREPHICIVDGVSSTSAEDVTQMLAAVKAQTNSQQIVLYSSCSQREANAEASTPHIAIGGEMNAMNFRHECVFVSQNTKVKLAMLFSLIHLQKDENFIVVTKHSSSHLRIQLLLQECGRNTVTLEKNATDAEIRHVHSSMKRGESDTLVLKDLCSDLSHLHFNTGNTTILFYDTPDTIADFIGKTSLILNASVNTIVSFLDAQQETLLRSLRCMVEREGGAHLRMLQRKFSDSILIEAREYIADKIINVRKLLALTRKKKETNQSEQYFKVKPDNDKDAKRARSEDQPDKAAEPVKKKVKAPPRRASLKHERNSYAEKMIENRKKIKKAKNVHDLKGLLPKGKFRKIRKRHERVERQKNPKLHSKQQRGGARKAKKGRR